jgi:hypothetical protein
VDGDGRRDLVVTNEFSGDVSIFLNTVAAPFTTTLRFRADPGPYGMTDLVGTLVAHAPVETTGVVAGDFDGDGVPDLVVLNAGANRFTLLRGDGTGGFFNPADATTYATDAQPIAAVAGDFNDDGHLDLAVLNQGSATVSIYLGDGTGGFQLATEVSAGNVPTGLSVRDVDGDGQLDLLVGNEFGDVLTLQGKGDGTFQPYRRASRAVTLAVADLNGDGQPDFVFADAGLDRVAVQYSAAGQPFSQDRQDGLLAPGAVQVVDLNGDGIPDLLVANSGGNSVVAYPGTGGGQFGPAHTFFAGTNPVAITVQDLNGDGIPDLVVANKGSNDVSVLFGQGKGDAWTLTPGPRLRVGAGPVATALRDVNHDGIPDLIVSDGQAHALSILFGVGDGFFDDRHPVVVPLPADPGALVSLPGNPAGIALLLPSAGEISVIANLATPAQQVLFATGGTDPVAAVAADVNGDGFLDFIVANNGDGRVSLVLGMGNEFALAQSVAASRPTDLVLAALAGDSVAVYVAQENDDSTASLLTFTLTAQLPTLPAQPPFFENGVLAEAVAPAAVPTGSEVVPREATEAVVPLNESTVGVVPIFLMEDTPETPALPPVSGAATSLLHLVIGSGGSSRGDNAPPGVIGLEGLFQTLVHTAAGWQAILEQQAVAGWRVLADAAATSLQGPTTLLKSALSALGTGWNELTALPFSDMAADVGRALLEAGTAAAKLIREQIAVRLHSNRIPPAKVGPPRIDDLPGPLQEEEAEPNLEVLDAPGEGPNSGLAPALVVAFFASGAWESACARPRRRRPAAWTRRASRER